MSQQAVDYLCLDKLVVMGMARVGVLTWYGVQVGSPPSNISWTPPGTAQHERSPFAGNKQALSRVSHRNKSTPPHPHSPPHPTPPHPTIATLIMPACLTTVPACSCALSLT